jgi:hypothetical protein
MNKAVIAARTHWKTACLLTLLLASAGCTVKWTPLYDATLDKDVTDFQQSVETYLTKLQGQVKPGCTYQNNLDFFQKSSVQLALMRTRINASQHPRQLQDILQSLTNTLNDLQKDQQLHDQKGDCMSNVAIADTQSAFDREFESMLAYELALKANQPPSAAPSAGASGTTPATKRQ